MGIIRFNDMVAVMKASLVQLQRAIKGFVVMSGPLEVMYNCFVFQRVPPEWDKAGYPCLKPLAAWIEDHFARLETTKNWLEHGPPMAYWLSGFFFPQGFMTAVKQAYSRDYKIAIDTLVVSCEVLSTGRSEVKAAPTDGVYIFGLYMEAARFDRKKMNIAESIPGELFDEMPTIWLKPCLLADHKVTNCYTCPLYKTSLRFGTLSTTGHSTNFVCSLDIPTTQDPSYWTRRGCAMLCMLDI